MPRRAGKIPSYCRHRASGRAVVRIDGKDHYLGPYGSPESHEEYERLIAEWREDCNAMGGTTDISRIVDAPSLFLEFPVSFTSFDGNSNLRTLASC